jgi:hypothetical protein
MTPLTLSQRLLLASWLEKAIAALRKGDLFPLAVEQWEQGERQSVSFGGQHAGWVSLPHAARSARVTDEAKLLAWAEKHLPAKVVTVTEVAVDDDLIAFLREHRPDPLRESRAVDPDWVADLLSALRKPGWYMTAEGEKLTAVPGVTVDEGTPSPRVNLDPLAQAVIRDAWRAGLIPAGDLLALNGESEVMPGAGLRSDMEPGVVTSPGSARQPASPGVAGTAKAEPGEQAMPLVTCLYCGGTTDLAQSGHGAWACRDARACSERMMGEEP